MKKLILSVTLLFMLPLFLVAQVPSFIRFDGVYRPDIHITRNLQIKASILQNDTVIYAETHPDILSKEGNYTIYIGGGNSDQGIFSKINWQTGIFKLNLKIRILPKEQFEDIGTIQLVSVPFAFQALNSGPWLNQGDSILINSYDKIVLKGENNPTPSQYSGNHKLYVNGSIICSELKVESVENWPDYVFEKEYELMSLDSLGIFISQNKHLPQIPSQEQMKEGYLVSEMNKKLIRKIEELTLYILELNRKIDKK